MATALSRIDRPKQLAETQCRVALVGFGTVGSAVARLLHARAMTIRCGSRTSAIAISHARRLAGLARTYVGLRVSNRCSPLTPTSSSS
jgi:homoserine dehydrogenase